jgi:hypothetical protein
MIDTLKIKDSKEIFHSFYIVFLRGQPIHCLSTKKFPYLLILLNSFFDLFRINIEHLLFDFL